VQLAEVLAASSKPTDSGAPLAGRRRNAAPRRLPPAEGCSTPTRAELAAMSGIGAFLAKVEGLYRANAPTSAAPWPTRAAGDAEALARAAHALKSMSFNIGAARVAVCAAAGELGPLGRLDADLALETRRRCTPRCRR
jgi:two-component system sensor histidine kinase BarA